MRVTVTTVLLHTQERRWSSQADSVFI